MEGQPTTGDSLRVAYAEPFLLEWRMATVVSDSYQLFYNLDSGRKKLFDIRSDPRAKTDIIDHEPKVTERLVAALEEWQRRVEAASQEALDQPAGAVTIDETTRQELEALGYLEESD
jgi:hypothetical protein